MNYEKPLTINNYCLNQDLQDFRRGQVCRFITFIEIKYQKWKVPSQKLIRLLQGHSKKIVLYKQKKKK
jgi:hypothetical protein